MIEYQTIPGRVITLSRLDRIWDSAPHNAFPTLLRFQDRWICAFREGKRHVGAMDDLGCIRVLQSTDGKAWSSLALLSDDTYDLRDAKLSIMPDGRLMLLCGATDPRESPGRARALRTKVAFSTDGAQWTVPQIVVGEWEWIWRITWHEGVGYGVAYYLGEYMVIARENRHGILYRTTDGLHYETIHRFEPANGAGETTLGFEPDGTMRLVMRSGVEPQNAILGTARPPYQMWNLHKVDFSLGGPGLIRLADGSWWLGTRDGCHGAKTVLAAIDFEHCTIRRAVCIDSNGKWDCSYPGFVWHDGQLWMIFYSSHEEKPSIYLAVFDMA